MTECRLKGYIAAPLFNSMEREFNQKLAERLSADFDFFLPQRDGALLVDLVRTGTPVSIGRTQVFERDLEAIGASDFVLAVLDGRVMDEGMCFELGYAYAKGKPCFGLKTDDRCTLPTGDNPMVTCALSEVYHSIEQCEVGLRLVKDSLWKRSISLSSSMSDSRRNSVWR